MDFRIAGRFVAPACLASLVACGGAVAPTGPAPGLEPGDHEVQVIHDGRGRSALVHVPASAAHGSPLPLLLAFHGGGGEARSFAANAGLDSVADREGFIVAYPFGTGPLPDRLLTWNAGSGCCGFARDRNVDDAGFSIALIDELSRLVHVDPRRVYATGHSNGAMMAYRVTAENADRIVAVVAVAGAMDLETFAPSREVAVMHIHSVDDPRALYDGGLGPPFPGTDHRVTHRAVEEGISLWTEHNGCAAVPDISEIRAGEDGSTSDGQGATLLVWPECRGGSTVEHWKLTGVGHGWPGRTDSGLRQDIVGPATTLIHAAEEIWSFVSRFRR